VNATRSTLASSVTLPVVAVLTASTSVSACQVLRANYCLSDEKGALGAFFISIFQVYF
jgi:hypothetical protein